MSALDKALECLETSEMYKSAVNSLTPDEIIEVKKNAEQFLKSMISPIETLCKCFHESPRETRDVLVEKIRSMGDSRDR
jgi:hypothetical protein